MAESKKEQKHFVLVHGACHGAWCWYKLKPMLEGAGHKVTAVDLAASGTHMKAIQDVQTLEEYTEPLLQLLASLPQNDPKVILVGHSLGGLNLALATDKFPDKVALGVYVAAFMPDTAHKPSFVLDQYYERTPAEAWLDTQFSPYTVSQQHLISMFFGHEFLSTKLYQNSPVEDLELAKALIRPGSLFMYDLAKSKNYSNEGFGSVPRVYIMCNEDKAMPQEFQRWMIDNCQVNEVKEIRDADHMCMLSKPQQLCDCLLEIAIKFAYAKS